MEPIDPRLRALLEYLRVHGMPSDVTAVSRRGAPRPFTPSTVGSASRARGRYAAQTETPEHAIARRSELANRAGGLVQGLADVTVRPLTDNPVMRYVHPELAASSQALERALPTSDIQSRRLGAFAGTALGFAGGSEPALAERLWANTLKDGGATVDAAGQAFRGNGYLVADPAFTAKGIGSASDVEDFLRRPDVQQRLQAPGAHVGTWRAPDGTLEINVSDRVHDLSLAHELGAARGEQEIGQFANSQFQRGIPVGQTLSVEHRTPFDLPGGVVRPQMQGTGPVPGAERARQAAFPDLYLPRSYFSTAGSPVEAGFEGLNAHTGTLHGLYDMEKDPLKLADAALAEANRRGIAGPAVASIQEQMVRDAGYTGYRRGNVIASFHPTRVEPQAAGAGTAPQTAPQTEPVANLEQPTYQRSGVPLRGRITDPMGGQPDLSHVVPNAGPPTAEDYARFGLTPPASSLTAATEPASEHAANAAQIKMLQDAGLLTPEEANPAIARREAQTGGTPPALADTAFAGAALERIRMPAIRLPDGQIVEGTSHADAAERAGAAESNGPSFDEGFTTSTGRYVSRNEALHIAGAADQIHPQLKAAAAALPDPTNPDFGLITEHLLQPPEAPAVHTRANIDALLPHLSTEMQASLTSGTPRMRATAVRIYNALGSATPVAALQEAMKAGAPAIGGYARSARALRATFGIEAPRFTRLMAALSPQQDVESNLRMALNVWDRWKQLPPELQSDPAAIHRIVGEASRIGDPTGKALPARLDNSVRALAGGDNPIAFGQHLSGAKVHSFYRNLLGELDATTLDTHHTQLENIKGWGHRYLVAPGQAKPFGTFGPTYLAGAARQTEAAAGLGLAPAQGQEAGWSWLASILKQAGDRGLGAADISRGILPEGTLEGMARAGVGQGSEASAMWPGFDVSLNEPQHEAALGRMGLTPPPIENAERLNLGAPDPEALAVLARNAEAHARGRYLLGLGLLGMGLKNYVPTSDTPATP